MDHVTQGRIKLARLMAVLGIVALGTALGARAGAAIIAPGGQLTPVGNGAFSGTVIYDNTSAFNSGTYAGSLHSQVYKESDGFLDFVYQFTNNNIAGADGIETIGIDSFNDLFT